VKDDPELEALTQYFEDMRRYPLLTAKAEKELAKRAKAGDVEAAHLLMHSNMRLVVSIAKKYTTYNIPLNDLIGYGNIGLAKAVQKYDPDLRTEKHPNGFKFSTYATWWIKQAISRAIADTELTVRIPVYLRGEKRKQAAVPVVSLDATIVPDSRPNDDALRLGDLATSDMSRLNQHIDQLARIQMLNTLVGVLTPKEKRAIALRFGFDRNGRERTLEACGKEMGIITTPGVLL
jgi:RNA polymerase sigma factor (sigma-70 family)